MGDYSEFVNLIKKAATEAVDASQPADVLFGKVTSASPLKILVDQKMILTTDQLVLSRNVTNFTVSVGINWNTETHKHTHTITDTYSGGGTASEETHSHQVKGTKSMTVYNALKSGDQVILLQCAGGQKFIVLDRLG